MAGEICWKIPVKHLKNQFVIKVALWVPYIHITVVTQVELPSQLLFLTSSASETEFAGLFI